MDQFRLWDLAIATQEIWELSRKKLEDPEVEAENNDLRIALRFDGTEEDASGNVGNITELWDMGYKSQPIDEFQFGPVAPYQYKYSGYQKDADWRVEAEERIEEHRMADVEVSVVDGQGNPIDGAEVDVQMLRHKFNFGTAINSYPLFNEQSYADKLQKNFNYATIENELKVYRWEGNLSTQDAVKNMVEWLNERDFGIRGHAALWKRWGWMNMDPEDEISQNDIHDYRDMTDEEIHDTVKSKIKNRVGEFSGQITDWDVQNHPFHRTAIRDHLGGRDPYVLEWWEAAHEVDPHANMGINEQNIIQKYWEPGWPDEYEEWIEWLIENNAGVEEIGFMAHGHINRLEGIPQVLDMFDRFGKYDIPLYISEFHVEIESDSWQSSSRKERDAQLAYTRDFVKAAFSHPDVETLVYWNFWAGSAWRENTVFYNQDWELRDHERMWQDLIYNKWWTDEEGSTYEAGLYKTSGFKGDYLIIASEGDASVSKKIVLDEDKKTEIVID